MKRLLVMLFAVCSLFFINGSATAFTDTVNAQPAVSTETIIPSEKVVILNILHSVTENPWTGEMYQPMYACSGFFIGSNGQIMTAAHCVEDENVIGVIIKTHDKKKYIAEILYVSKRSDLALLKINSTDTPHFDVAETVYQGEEVCALGHPLHEQYTLTKGIIAKVTNDYNLLDMTVLPGSSGCPIYNRNGQLVGVTSAGKIVYFGVSGLNISVSLRDIYYFLDLFKGL